MILNSGDHIQFQCQYNSMTRANVTVSGPATHNEMCSFALYVTSVTKGRFLCFCWQLQHTVFSFRQRFLRSLEYAGNKASSINLCPAGPDLPNLDCQSSNINNLRIDVILSNWLTPIALARNAKVRFHA
jgi:hypothetical protein